MSHINKELTILSHVLELDDNEQKKILVGLKKHKKRSSHKEKILSFFGLGYIFIELLFYSSKAFGKEVFYENLPKTHVLRKDIISRYTGKESLGFSPNANVGGRGSFSMTKRLLITWICIVRLRGLSIVNKTSISSYEYMIFARILIKRKVIIENNNIENIYIFMVYFTPNYLASRYLQKHAKVHYYISEAPITSPINLSMFSTWKYFESIICCSSFELEEVDILKENEMIYFDTKILWGAERVDILDKYDNRDHTKNKWLVDIGIYTQGYRARGDDLMRLSSLSKIKNNNFSLYHYHEQEMIENILSMFGNTKYSIVIYPHPHEINIFKKIDKKPQYFSYLQTYKNLSISTEKKDGAYHMEDVNVGVTTFSSLGIIRLEFGFPICFYIEKSQNGFFSPGLESSFSDHFSFDKAGLITQIHQQLNSSKGS